MTKKRLSSEPSGAYAELLSLLETNLKFMVGVGLDEKRSADYRSLLTYLRSKSIDEIEQILHSRRVVKERSGAVVEKPTQKVAPQTPPDLTDAEILQISAVELSERLNDGRLRRLTLERIAIVRFSMTTGALSTLRTRDALQEKLINVLSNENTHRAIARVAEGSQLPKISSDDGAN